MNAFKGILDVDIDIVAHELRGVTIALAVKPDRADERSCDFVNRDTRGLDLVGQAAGYTRDAVLHINGRNVERTRQLEHYGDLAGPVVSADGGHVAHAFNAVYGLFQDGGYG